MRKSMVRLVSSKATNPTERSQAMSHFTKRTEITASFDKGDVESVATNISSYNNSFSMQTRNDETVIVKFANKADLKQTLEAIISTALALNWENDYDSEYRYPGNNDQDNLITVEQVLGWKQTHQNANDRDLQALREKLA
jgi:hypothetical protein